MKKIVIELSDETYNDVIKEHYFNVSNTNIYNAIRNGKLLETEEETKAQPCKLVKQCKAFRSAICFVREPDSGCYVYRYMKEIIEKENKQ